MSSPDNETGLFEDIAPENQQEDESDLQAKISFKDAVVMNADWTFETINGQINKGNIELEPGFQRRAAWDSTRQSRLVESIIVGLPIPNIVLAENKNHRGKFIVIDGKQRLLAVNEFMKGNVVLKGLDIRPDLNGKTYASLPSEDREYFENNTLRSTVIRNWSDQNFLYTIFYRLNSGSLPLSPQELRKALIGGKLLDEIETYILRSEPFHRVFGNGLDRRMRDSELVLRFIAFDQAYADYDGNLKVFLDRATQYYETEWDSKKDELLFRFERLDRALDCCHAIFDDNAFKKWLGQGFERRINRAIFDCLTRFFADEEHVLLAKQKKQGVVEAYEAVCLEPRFREAIEKTTKTAIATRTRINIWGQALAKVLDKSYDDKAGMLAS